MAWLRRCVALCLLLSMGVATAAPLVQPRSMELVCAGTGGVKLLLHSKAALAAHEAAGMDCLLCLLESAPPGVPTPPLPVALAHGDASAVPVSTWFPVSTAALPPARAPPVSPVF